MTTPEIVGELAHHLSEHRLVPFLGAGCSKGQLGVGWPEVIADMKVDCVSENDDYLDVAQDYVDKFGKDGLATFLKPRLTATAFDDAKGTIHRLVMAMGTGVVFTTNQDNVFELCATKYGRAWRSIVELSDFGAVLPGERLYVKYHGDLSKPSSVVFARSDYLSRNGDLFNPLNVRLRSDLLAKRLLFLGYGLQDSTLHSMMLGLHTNFGGRLPPSYLLSYGSADYIRDTCKHFGIKAIDPCREMKESDPNRAIERFLSALVTEAMKLTYQRGFEALGDPTVPPQRVLIQHELEMLESTLPTLSVREGVDLFRRTLDLVEIPDPWQARVSDLVVGLAERATSVDDSEAIRYVPGNIMLRDYRSALVVLAAVMSTANLREDGGYNSRMHISFMYTDFPEGHFIVGAACAIELLLKWNRKIGNGFRVHASEWATHSDDADDLPESQRDYVKAQYNRAWSVATTFTNPLKLQKESAHRVFRGRSARTIAKSMMDSMPKTKDIF